MTDLERYRNDPVKFAEEILNKPLTEEETSFFKEIVDSGFFEGKRTLVMCTPHRGRSFVDYLKEKAYSGKHRGPMMLIIDEGIHEPRS